MAFVLTVLPSEDGVAIAVLGPRQRRSRTWDQDESATGGCNPRRSRLLQTPLWPWDASRAGFSCGVKERVAFKLRLNQHR
jgi:hypothetical protein